MRLQSGAQLGPYAIEVPLGAGGMGEVYRARDTRLDRSVALKVLPAEFSANAMIRSRFEREAKAISSLSHPNICTLHDIGREGDTHYLVMEYSTGRAWPIESSAAPSPSPSTRRFASGSRSPTRSTGRIGAASSTATSSRAT